jgi:hypothetical protein
MHFRFLLAQDFGLKAGDIRAIFVARPSLATKIPSKKSRFSGEITHKSLLARENDKALASSP